MAYGSGKTLSLCLIRLERKVDLPKNIVNKCKFFMFIRQAISFYGKDKVPDSDAPISKHLRFLGSLTADFGNSTFSMVRILLGM